MNVVKLPIPDFHDLPNLGLDRQIRLVKWLVPNHSEVRVGQVIAQLESDVVTLDYETHESGVLTQLVRAGRVVRNDEIIDEITTNKETKEEKIELISCKACNHKISPMAEACPNCGHPNSSQGPEVVKSPPKKYAVPKPTCYQCSEEAVQLCNKCGVESCLTHLEPVQSKHLKGLVCEECFESHERWNTASWIIVAFILIVMLAISMAN